MSFLDMQGFILAMIGGEFMKSESWKIFPFGIFSAIHSSCQYLDDKWFGIQPVECGSLGFLAPWIL